MCCFFDYIEFASSIHLLQNRVAGRPSRPFGPGRASESSEGARRWGPGDHSLLDQAVSHFMQKEAWPLLIGNKKGDFDKEGHMRIFVRHGQEVQLFFSHTSPRAMQKTKLDIATTKVIWLTYIDLIWLVPFVVRSEMITSLRVRSQLCRLRRTNQTRMRQSERVNHELSNWSWGLVFKKPRLEHVQWRLGRVRAVSRFWSSGSGVVIRR